MACRSGQSSYDPYKLSSDDDDYIMPKGAGEMTPGRINRATRIFTATRLYLNSPPELPQNWDQVIQN